MTEARDDRGIESLERSLAIVDGIMELDGAGVTELADHLGFPPSTVHSHLVTLEENEYLVKTGDIYRIGLKFLYYGGYARHRKEGYTMAIEMVPEIANETGERAQFMVQEHDRGIYLHTATGDHAVQVDARIGKRSYLHASAAGKAILAFLQEPKLESTLASMELVELTPNTITDSESLLDELGAIRDRGYSFNLEESISGLQAVGVPVMDPGGRVLGALSVSGPAHRMKNEWLEEEIPDLLLGLANELELNIAYS